MRLQWPAKTTDPDTNYTIDRLRGMLDNLNEDILADQPDDYDDYNQGEVEYQAELAEGDEEMLAELAEGDPFEDDEDMADSEEEDMETSDQGNGSEDGEQISKETKSQQSDGHESGDGIAVPLFGRKSEEVEAFSFFRAKKGTKVSPPFKPPTFLKTPGKATADDQSATPADTNKKHEPDSTPDLRGFHKLFANSKPVAGLDPIKSQQEEIVNDNSTPDALKIGNIMDEDTNPHSNKSPKEKEAEPKNTLEKAKPDDIQPGEVSSQEEAAVLDDTPSKKRKAADQSSTEVDKIQDVLPFEHQSYTEPFKQDTATVLDGPNSQKRRKTDDSAAGFSEEDAHKTVDIRKTINIEVQSSEQASKEKSDAVITNTSPVKHDMDNQSGKKKKAMIPGESVSKSRKVVDRSMADPGRTIHIPIRLNEEVRKKERLRLAETAQKGDKMDGESPTKTIQKNRKVPRDVPDELSSEDDAVGHGRKKMNLAELLSTTPPGSGQQSRSQSPIKGLPPPSIKPKRPRPTSAYIDRSNAAPTVTAQNVNAQAQIIRSPSAPLLDGPGFGMLKDTQPDNSNDREHQEAEEKSKGWRDTVQSLKSSYSTLKGTITHRGKKDRPDMLSKSTSEMHLGTRGGRGNKKKKDTERKASGPSIFNMFDSKKRSEDHD